MTGEIVEALGAELKKLFEGTGTQIIRDSQFKLEDMPVYTAGLVILSLNNANDAQWAIGGATMADWGIGMKCFFYDDNSMLEDDQGATTQAYNIIDTIKNHFEKEDWLSAEMIAMVPLYGFKMMLTGIEKSTELQSQGGGIIPGYEISFDTWAIDTATSFVQPQSFAHEKLEGVTFSGDDGTTKYNWLPDVVKFVADLTAYNAMTTATVGESYYVVSEKSIYTVKTIDTVTHLITASVIYALVLNNVFISIDDTAYCWLFVTDVVKKPLTTFELD
jgi:hypothetical protein